MTEEIRQKLTGAVIGLARTCENNEKTESTDRVFLEALTMAGDWSASIFDMSEMLEKVRNEKYTVSPGCVTCLTVSSVFPSASVVRIFNVLSVQVISMDGSYPRKEYLPHTSVWLALSSR